MKSGNVRLSLQEPMLLVKNVVRNGQTATCWNVTILYHCLWVVKITLTMGNFCAVGVTPKNICVLQKKLRGVAIRRLIWIMIGLHE